MPLPLLRDSVGSAAARVAAADLALPAAGAIGSAADAADRCPLCASAAATTHLASCRDRLMGVAGEWNIVRCSDCGLEYTSPRTVEADLDRYYPEQWHVYHPTTPVRRWAVGALLRWLALSPYIARFGEPEWLPQPFDNRCVLDVGCGAGSYLRSMSDLGWRCFGIDLSPAAVRASRATVPAAKIEQGTLTTFAPDTKFALIALRHVLEHLPEPIESLRRCTRLLDSGGLLHVMVPNADSAEARLFGRRWIGRDIPRHLVHFNRRTLTDALRRAGLEVVSMRPAMCASSLSDSVALSLPVGLARRLLASRVGRLLYFALVFPACVSYVVGNQPVLEVIARKAEVPS